MCVRLCVCEECLQSCKMSLVNYIFCILEREKSVSYIFSLPEMLSCVYARLKHMRSMKYNIFSLICLCVCSADEYKSELGQQLSLIAGSLVGGVCIVSLVAIAIICTR